MLKAADSLQVLEIEISRRKNTAMMIENVMLTVTQLLPYVCTTCTRSDVVVGRYKYEAVRAGG